MTELKQGDEVTITIKGKVSGVGHQYLEITKPGGSYIEIYAGEEDYDVVVTQEAVVNYTKPGMVVKNKRTGNTYSIVPGKKVYSHQTQKVSVIPSESSINNRTYDLIAGG